MTFSNSASCRLEFCGNGNLEPGEACDDGKSAACDGCSAECLSTEICGKACNDVCAAVGPVPVDDATAFAAQDAEAECVAISQAWGLGSTVNHGSYSSACLEDTMGDRNSPAPMGSLLCSSSSSCPASHRTNMDQLGIACGAGSRSSICACQ